MSTASRKPPPATPTTPPAGHRERLLEALATSIRETGFAGTKVADVVRLARTSRRTFYEHFEDREAAYLALNQAIGEMLLEQIERAVDPAVPLPEQIDQAIDTYIEMLGVDPALTVSWSRELPALGEAGAEWRRRSLEQFAELCMRLVNTEDNRRAGIPPVSRDAAALLCAGLGELVVLAAERGEDLEKLAPVAKAVFKAVLAPGG
jgi:AcrR family transcriptional regulator